jgi:hypothetical protein
MRSPYFSDKPTASQPSSPSSFGNNNLVWMPTSTGRGTVVWWGEAPEGTTAGRVRLGDQEQTVGVEGGFVFGVFDNVLEQEFRPYADAPAPLHEHVAALPKVVEWTR